MQLHDCVETAAQHWATACSSFLTLNAQPLRLQEHSLRARQNYWTETVAVQNTMTANFEVH